MNSDPYCELMIRFVWHFEGPHILNDHCCHLSDMFRVLQTVRLRQPANTHVGITYILTDRQMYRVAQKSLRYLEWP